MDSVDVDRLKFIAESLFENGPWAKSVASYLDVHESTVHRWITRNDIPRSVEIALEHSFSHGLLKKYEPERVYV